MSVKLNKKQSIITNKFSLIFQEKESLILCDPCDTLGYAKDCLSGITGVKFIELNQSGNINYSSFQPGWAKLYNIHWWGGKLKLFSPVSGFIGHIFTGEPSRVDTTWGTETRYFPKKATELNLFVKSELPIFSFEIKSVLTELNNKFLLSIQ